MPIYGGNERLRDPAQTGTTAPTMFREEISAAKMMPDKEGKDADRRALLVASAGGHWIELCRLGAAFRGWDCQYVSTGGGMIAPVGGRDVLEVSDSSRDDMRTMLRSIGQLMRIIRSFRPDIVVSTGAAPGALALLIGKCHGARTIWIDSIANSEQLSLSGRAVKAVADLRLTQWPALADKAKGIDYFGQVL